MNRILILGAPFGTGNLGVNALAGGALAMLSHAAPQADVAFLDYGRAPTVTRLRMGEVERDVPLVDLRFSWKPWLANNIATLLLLALLSRLAGRRLQASLVRHHRWLARIASADVALAVSGGDSFADLYGLGRLWYVVLPQLLVLALDVPLVLLPQTIGPFRRPFARRLAAFVLRRATRVNARDPAGVLAARALVGARPEDAEAVRFCPDLAFLLPARRPGGALSGRVAALLGDEVASPRRPRVALNMSGLLAMGGYGGGNDFGLHADHLALCVRLVTWFVEEAGADVLLVPHVVAGAESDVLAAQALLARLPPALQARVRSAGEGYGADEIKWLVGRCDFLVGARMHACIAALSQGIPAVGLAYSGKFAGVFDSVGAGDLVADQRRLDAEQTLQFTALAFARREASAARLAAALPAVRERVLRVLDDLDIPRAEGEPAMAPSTRVA